MEDQSRAKEIFTAYLGQFIHMYREGVLEEYKKYEITEQTEKDWFDEMVDLFSKELSIMNWDGIIHLEALARNYPQIAIFENATAFAARHLMSADSLVKFVYAEKMIALMKLFKQAVPLELLYKAYKSTIEILEDTIAKPLVLDPGHELVQFHFKDKKDLNIKARRNIDELRAFIN